VTRPDRIITPELAALWAKTVPAPEEPEESQPQTKPRPRQKPATAKGRPDSAKAKAGDRFAVLNGFVDFSMAGLSRAEVTVWFVLYRDTRDGTARTSVADLARRTGCNRVTVFRALHKLKRRGLVKAVYHGGIGRGVSRYRVLAFENNR
jgi:IclR helix-turn-helix domain